MYGAIKTSRDVFLHFIYVYFTLGLEYIILLHLSTFWMFKLLFWDSFFETIRRYNKSKIFNIRDSKFVEFFYALVWHLLFAVCPETRFLRFSSKNSTFRTRSACGDDTKINITQQFPIDHIKLFTECDRMSEKVCKKWRRCLPSFFFYFLQHLSQWKAPPPPPHQ